MNDYQIVVSFFAAVGVIYVAIGIPLWWKIVPPNSFYGFRTPKTQSSPEIWYDVNEFGGKQMTLFGTAFIIVSIPLLILSGYGIRLGDTKVLFGALVVLSLLPVIISFIYYFRRYLK